MGARRQIEEGVDEQQQQQSQHQGQAPVVGDQHLVAAGLQEGAALLFPGLFHGSAPSDHQTNFLGHLADAVYAVADTHKKTIQRKKEEVDVAQKVSPGSSYLMRI